MVEYWKLGAGRRMGVAGMGRSGRAAARLLSSCGFEVTGFDDSTEVEPCEWLSALLTGPGQEAGLERLEGLVLSPGIPPGAPLPAAATDAGIPVIGEIELAFRHAQAPVLAVTGSNGKTTSAEWLGFVLGKAGLEAVVSGNVGYPFSDAVIERPSPDWYVLELSSYQLETIETFRPCGAAVLNITPDHLQRHGDMEGYGSAKARIFMNQHSEDLTVLNADDPGSFSLLGRTMGMEALFSTRSEVRTGADCTGDMVTLAADGARMPVIAASRLSLRGRHNLENALAVACLARRAGLKPEEMVRGLATFPGVPHRIETVRVLGGVAWVNDSKSTNQDSLKVALESFDTPVVLIAGGLSKKTAYAELSDLIRSRVTHVVLIGSAAEELAEAWAGTVPMHMAGDMAKAVSIARDLAGPGDTVLLSPACASFDQYRDFEKRGEHFRRIVEDLR